VKKSKVHLMCCAFLYVVRRKMTNYVIFDFWICMCTKNAMLKTWDNIFKRKLCIANGCPITLHFTLRMLLIYTFCQFISNMKSKITVQEGRHLVWKKLQLFHCSFLCLNYCMKLYPCQLQLSPSTVWLWERHIHWKCSIEANRQYNACC
jgi:hypothetical protein